jgi:hypothetical protein
MIYFRQRGARSSSGSAGTMCYIVFRACICRQPDAAGMVSEGGKGVFIP